MASVESEAGAEAELRPHFFLFLFVLFLCCSFSLLSSSYCSFCCCSYRDSFTWNLIKVLSCCCCCCSTSCFLVALVVALVLYGAVQALLVGALVILVEALQ